MRTDSRAWAWARLVTVAALVLAVVVVEQRRGWNDVDLLQDRVDAAGPWGAVVFVAGYAVLCLLPTPKALLTTLGGVLFDWWLGALLSWVAALAGAALAFWLGRAWGRDAVDRLTHGRVERADQLLSQHGFAAVLAVRLTPVLPFTAINYAAGLTGVRWSHYALGSVLGMVPGSLAYAALGASGSDPWGLFAGAAALVALVALGALLGRRLLRNDDALEDGRGEDDP